MKTEVTPEQIGAFQRDGAICLRGLLSDREIGLIENGIESNLQSLSTRTVVASRPEDPGFFVEDFCNWQANPSYKEFIFQSQVGMIAGLLMQSRVVRLYHDHLLVKEPGTQQPTPWHQDQPYYNIEGNQNLSMWIPVDPVPREASLEFVAGSHKGPWYVPRTFRDNRAKWFPEGTLSELPDINGNPDQYRLLGWEVIPGDVVCFHMLTLHAAGPATRHQRRRVFSVRFLGEDITHAPREWATSPDFPGLKDELPAGAPMEHHLFPVLWQAL